MADLYLTPAEKYTAALGGFYYGDLPEPGTVYTQLIKDILDGSTPDKVPKNILARFIYSLYISDLGDPYPRYELAKLLYWKLHDITPTKSGSVLTVTIDGKEDYMTINTDLSRLWYKVLFGSKTDVITEFPYIFNTIQNKLSDWELFGNVSVSGTPTPDNPIMPQGTGERTGNLFDSDNWYGAYKASTGVYSGTVNNFYVINCKPFKVDDVGKTFTFRIKMSNVTSTNVRVRFTSGGVVTNGKNLSADGYSSVSFTVSSTDDSVGIGYGGGGGNAITFSEIMLNTGSEALPYEPYGVKIPISSAGQTTPVYLGEVETTRRVKKLGFDGTENWRESSDGNLYIALSPNQGVAWTRVLSTHFTSSQVQTNGGLLWFVNANVDFDTAEECKSYLAAQYAAGTPVTVWYVLATEETGIVNEPLMKIGNYADSMSKTQTGIDIPTVVGQNTLDVLTTVKPSSMSIEYTSADENRSRSKRISLLKSPLKKGMIK